MGCLWQPLNRTMELHHNINFPKRDCPNIQILHWKSVIFDAVFNFLNMPLNEGWPTHYVGEGRLLEGGVYWVFYGIFYYIFHAFPYETCFLFLLENCFLYICREIAFNRSQVICGGREFLKHVYISVSNSIQISVFNPPELDGEFLLHYQGTNSQLQEIKRAKLQFWCH